MQNLQRQTEEVLVENILEWLYPRWRQSCQNNEKLLRIFEAEANFVKEVFRKEILTEDDQQNLKESLERLQQALKIYNQNNAENIF